MADILFISLQAMDKSVPQKYSRFFFLSTYRERGAEFLCGVAINLSLLFKPKLAFVYSLTRFKK